MKASQGNNSRTGRSNKRQPDERHAATRARPREQTNRNSTDKTLRQSARANSGDGGFGASANYSPAPIITELFFAAAKIGIPDSSITVSECADKYRVLAPERSARPGPWSTDFVPYLREIQDSCSDPTIWKVVFVKANQIAGTECANNVILHRIYAKPSSVHYTAENEDKVKAWSTESLATMIRDTPVLNALIKGSRTRDSGNTIKAKKFPGAHLSLGWSTSAATGSSRPREVVICDEIDAYIPTPEGNYVDIVVLRTETFEDRLVFLLSTPRNRPENPAGTAIDAPRFSPIEREYEEGDKRKYFLRCPNPRCHHHQHLRWEQIRWDDRDREAWYICEKNGCLIDEGYKPEMLAEGHWRAEKPCEGIASFHLNKLYSPFPNATWLHVVKLYLKAKRSGDPNAMKVWVNTSRAEGYQDDDTKVETRTLKERRENYYGTVPAGVLILCAGVDVQANRLEMTVWGEGLNRERWAIDDVVIEGDPTHANTWARLKLELVRRWPSEDGKSHFKIWSTGVDTGYNPDQVRKFCRDNRGLRVWAIKGSSSHTAPLVSRPSLWGHPPIKLFSIGTVGAKDEIFAVLKVPEPGPGYVHFPIEEQKFDEAFFRQLMSEHRVPVKKGLKPGHTYELLKPGMRNEALDKWVYARAALAIINPPLEAMAAEMAELGIIRNPSMESGPREELPCDIPEGFKVCDKPDCDRLTQVRFAFCCHGCTLAADGEYEIHEDGPLGHSEKCNERHRERSQPLQQQTEDEEPEIAIQREQRQQRQRRRSGNFATSWKKW